MRGVAPLILALLPAPPAVLPAGDPPVLWRFGEREAAAEIRMSGEARPVRLRVPLWWESGASSKEGIEVSGARAHRREGRVPVFENPGAEVRVDVRE
jgi:hypothetical protein